MPSRFLLAAAAFLIACGESSPTTVDATSDATTDPVAACGLVNAYRTPHTDCGPLPPQPPDAAPPICFWTLHFGLSEPDDFTFQYSDVGVSGHFHCEGTQVIGTTDGAAPPYVGTIDLATGTLEWDGLSYDPY